MTDVDLPPQDLDAEESVLGSMLQADKAILAVIGTGLSGQDFYRDSNRRCFEAIVSMFNEGAGVEPITVADRLGMKTSADRAVLRSYVAMQPASVNAAHYAQIVKKQAFARRLVSAGQRVARVGYDQPGDETAMLAEAENALGEATKTATIEQAGSMADGSLDELVNDIREAVKTGKPIQGSLTGLRDLDHTLNGLWNGQLIIVAARPAQGKSALALNVAENFADRDESVLFVSLEMSKYELQIRSLARAARLDSMRLARGEMNAGEQTRFAEGLAKVKARNKLFVQDSGTSVVATLNAEALRLQRQEDLKLIVVDYLQLMQGGGDTRNEEVSQISRGLKVMARNLHIPIIALAQMNRSIETRGEKRPMLSDLRDSGSLEQDGDVVIFLHDDAAYDKDAEPSGTVELIVAKNRKGPTDTVKVAYNRAWNTFKDLGGTT